MQSESVDTARPEFLVLAVVCSNRPQMLYIHDAYLCLFSHIFYGWYHHIVTSSWYTVCSAENWELLKYPFKCTKQLNHLCDIHDGSVLQELMKPSNFLSVPEHTGFIMCTDGVPMFKSSEGSLWPVYLAITSLPPLVRMNYSYLLLAGIWSGPVKPDMSTLLQPTLEKITMLNTEGVSVMTPDGHKLIRAKLLIGIFDLPAKASVTNMKQFNGEYGCTFCTDKGTLISRNRRVYLPDDDHSIRTPEQMKKWTERAVRSNQAVMGIKGVSILSQAIQIPECVPPDYMHAVLEGTIKSLLKNWFDPANHGKAYYLGLHKKNIDKLAAQIKPPTEINRAPRSLELLSFWKASEFRAWMLYYSLPLLKAFLPSEYIHHLALLISALHILLSEAIPTTSIDVANEMLCTFYKLMPKL